MRPLLLVLTVLLFLPRSVLAADQVAPLTWNPGQTGDLTLEPGSPWTRVRPRSAVLELLVRHDADQPVAVTVLSANKPDSQQVIRIAPGDWQRVVLPLAIFAGTPAAVPTLTLRAADPTCGMSFAPAGDPRWLTDTGISDAQLLTLLDLQRPELAAVRQAHEAGDLAGAIRALASHFRTRDSVHWTLPSPPATGDEQTAALTAADHVVRGQFTMVSNTHTYANGEIDWLLDPTAGGAYQTNEWLWAMNRHEIANKLYAAWSVQPNPIYPQTWARAIRSWVQAMPVPATLWHRPGSGWRYIEAGLRMGEFWPNAWFGVAGSAAVSDDDRLLMVKSFWEHGEFLARQTTGYNNHFVIGLTGLYLTATLFPEFKASERWRQDAARLLQDFVTNHCDADAGWFERSPSYHLWLVQKLAFVLNAGRINGHRDDFTSAFRTHLRRMAEWNVKLAAPDWVVPALNDSTRDHLRRICADTIRQELPESPILAWGAAVAAGTTDLPAPLPASEFLADTGYAIMRTGWATNASYLLFDVGPMGGLHGHLDALNLIYAPDGTMTIFDGTGGTYSASPFRSWSVSTASHNTVLVDGRNQYRPGDSDADHVGLLPAATPPATFAQVPGGIYTQGWHIGGYGRDATIRVRHHREILFLTATGIALVIDSMHPEDDQPHAYDLRWQVQTTTWSTAARGTIIPTRSDQPLMAIIPLAGGEQVSADSGVTKPEILGWDVVKSSAPVPALTVRHRKQTTGTTRFVTALVPGSQLGKTPDLRITESAAGWQIDLGKPGTPLQIRLTDSACDMTGADLPPTGITYTRSLP